MRKVLCSIGAGPHEQLLARSGPTFEIFAARHGYDLDLRRASPTPERPPAWGKVTAILELLGRYDLVLWVDADAAIVDPTDDVADALGRRDLMALVAHTYDGQEVPNSGVWLLRRHRRTRRFLERIWARTEFVDHKWWENAAVIDELGYSLEPTVQRIRRSRMRDRTRLLDHSWNSIQVDPAPHPRVNHYPGRSQEFRLEHLSADLETARAVAATLVHPSVG